MIKKFLKVLMVLVFMSQSALTFEVYEHVRANHIMVKTQAEAIQIKKDIDGGGDFAYYARRYSLCPSGKRGGDLGYFGRGRMVKAFEDNAFELPIGVVSEPVETQFGWHLIQVTDKR